MPAGTGTATNTIDGILKDIQADGFMEFQMSDNVFLFNLLTGGFQGGQLRPSAISSDANMTKGGVRSIQDIYKGIVIRNVGQGRALKFPTYAGVGGGVGVVAEGGSLPPNNDPLAIQTSYTGKRLWGRIQLTSDERDLVVTPTGAFVEGVQFKMTDMASEVVWDAARQSYGDSTGILALINGTASSATQTVDTPDNRYLRKGMLIDVTDGGSTVRNTNDLVIIEGMDVGGVTTSVVFGASVAATDNDILVRAGSAASPGGNTADEADGLSIIGDNTSTLGNINPGTAGNGFWQSAFYVTTGTTVTKSVLDLRRLDYFKRNLHNPKIIVTTPDIEQKLASDIVGDRRFGGAELDLNLGYRALDYNGIPVVGDQMCPGGRMFFLDPGYLHYVSPVAGGFKWVAGSDGNLQWTGTSDVWNAALNWKWQLITTKRSTIGQQTGLTT